MATPTYAGFTALYWKSKGRGMESSGEPFLRLPWGFFPFEGQIWTGKNTPMWKGSYAKSPHPGLCKCSRGGCFLKRRCCFRASPRPSGITVLCSSNLPSRIHLPFRQSLVRTSLLEKNPPGSNIPPSPGLPRLEHPIPPAKEKSSAL